MVGLSIGKTACCLELVILRLPDKTAEGRQRNRSQKHKPSYGRALKTPWVAYLCTFRTGWVAPERDAQTTTIHRAELRVYCTVNLASINSTEFPPAIIVNVPGSTTRFMSRFKNDNSLKPRVKVTVFVSPGFSDSR
jgi:hypothetical protein